MGKKKQNNATLPNWNDVELPELKDIKFPDWNIEFPEWNDIKFPDWNELINQNTPKHSNSKQSRRKHKE